MKDICKIFLFCLLFISCSKKTENSEIKTIKFKHSVASIISANYMKKSMAGSGSEINFFTPDEKTIKYIEKKLPETSGVIHKWLDLKLQKLSKIDANHIQFYDKQYIGFVNFNNDSIVSIKLFNFETDPYNIKPKFGKKFIVARGQWEITNTCRIEYSKKLKKFTQRFE